MARHTMWLSNYSYHQDSRTAEMAVESRAFLEGSEDEFQGLAVPESFKTSGTRTRAKVYRTGNRSTSAKLKGRSSRTRI
jgi:hypothetical protein